MKLPRYRASWFVADAIAGLTIASMAVPQCMAVAQLAGMPAVTGLYAVIGAMLMYGLFGASRHLAMGPEPTLAILVAPTLVTVAGGDPTRYAALAAGMAVMSGAVLLAARFLRLGFMADLLPRAVVLGYINGVALSLVIDQLAPLGGIRLAATEPLPVFLELLRRLHELHLLSLVIGLCVLGMLLGFRRLSGRFPAALAAVIAAGVVAVVFDLEDSGVPLIGQIPAGVPAPRVPDVSFEDLVKLIPGALAASALVFTDGVITARAVARPGHTVDDERELLGFGAASIGAGLLQGFPIGVSASRTALAIGAGARTRAFGWIAAAGVVLVLLFVTAPLRYIPRTALAAVIIAAALALFDVKGLRRMWRVQRHEAVLAVTTTIAVLVLGLLPAIGLGVILALGILIWHIARPHDAVLGAKHGIDGFHDIKRLEDPQVEPGVIAYRFDAPLFSANAEYLRTQVLSLIERATTPVRWFILDAEAIGSTDTTALEQLSQLARDLRARDATLVLARVKGPLRDIFERAGLVDELGAEHLFPTVESAVNAFLDSRKPEGSDARG